MKFAISNSTLLDRKEECIYLLVKQELQSYDHMFYVNFDMQKVFLSFVYSFVCF